VDAGRGVVAGPAPATEQAGSVTGRRVRPQTTLDPARRVAYSALRAVTEDDAYLNLALARLLDGAELTGRDAAFATELANGTVRLQGRYDAILATCLAAGVAGLQSEVLIALRMGAHQVLGMRVPPHAAVSTSVELVRDAVGERPVRLVNAVLRRIAATPLDEWLERLPLPERCSHPAWIVAAFRDALERDGADDTELERLLAADNEPPSVTLAVRPGLASVADLQALGARPTRLSPYGAWLPAGAPGDLPPVRSGIAGVQDEGSQLAALALTRAAVTGRDERWLDMCAGPGGKAALLSGLARQGGATLYAAERHPHRAVLVAKALRSYPRPRPVVVVDGAVPAWAPAAFDRVLVDAPCTGLGALRRRPEARWRRTPSDLPALVALQRSLLRSALDSTRPGGVVAYVTCSPHRAETRDVVDAVLETRGDVREEDAREPLLEIGALGPGPHAQLWPHRHGTDAMFVALLRRAQ
jgi:16S rRNA (cytosine967-C5)-methyltransferase